MSYQSFTFDPSNEDIARRLAAGEDPASIPGVQIWTDQQFGQLAPSDEANERRLAQENYENGVSYSRDSSDLDGQ